MNKIEMNLLYELIKNSKKSDRELAKVLGVSQATISRMRNKLVKDGVIKEFTVIPDFVKMGYEIMAISCVKKKGVTMTTSEKVMQCVQQFPNIIFLAKALGMGKNGVMISLHKDYTDYSNFVTEQLQYWKDDMVDYDTMLISLKEGIVKPLSLKSLAELKETSEK